MDAAAELAAPAEAETSEPPGPTDALALASCRLRRKSMTPWGSRSEISCESGDVFHLQHNPGDELGR
jgi:hypothetical protein